MRVTTPSVDATDAWLADILTELRARAGALREAEAIALIVDRVDGAMEARRLDRLRALLDAVDPAALRDDVALALLIATAPATAPLRGVREGYAARLRAELHARSWTDADLATAIDDLL